MTKIRDIYDDLSATLLMSLHQEPRDQILSGQKIIEYRKKFYDDAFQAFVHTTGKDGGIELFIQFDKPIVTNADKLAKIGELLQNDDYSEIYEYYMPKNIGYIIPIKSVTEISKISLEELRDRFPGYVVPQAYLFLDSKPELLDFLLNQECGKTKNIDWNQRYKEIEKILSN
ncbi:hypothetical protein [Lactobacillus terrae]|uniref:hypothetical protein n=1 Tax=Lactobacillus terrae TaxID=2269374 RepID=UPI000C1B76C8|nr:hypothetical protein [Lactobacillus terrae]